MNTRFIVPELCIKLESIQLIKLLHQKQYGYKRKIARPHYAAANLACHLIFLFSHDLINI